MEKTLQLVLLCITLIAGSAWSQVIDPNADHAEISIGFVSSTKRDYANGPFFIFSSGGSFGGSLRAEQYFGLGAEKRFGIGLYGLIDCIGCSQDITLNGASMGKVSSSRYGLGTRGYYNMSENLKLFAGVGYLAANASGSLNFGMVASGNSGLAYEAGVKYSPKDENYFIWGGVRNAPQPVKIQAFGGKFGDHDRAIEFQGGVGLRFKGL